MNFTLSKLEKKQIVKDIERITSQLTLPISVFEEENEQFTPGYNNSEEEVETSRGWQDNENYKCTPIKINQINIKRYDYGELEEGDLILLFPNDTSLPKKNKYKVEYNNREYISKTGILEKKVADDLLLYKMVVFKL